MRVFVYLIPALRSFRRQTALRYLATVKVFAMPPMIRLTRLGIQQVSPSSLSDVGIWGEPESGSWFKAAIARWRMALYGGDQPNAYE